MIFLFFTNLISIYHLSNFLLSQFSFFSLILNLKYALFNNNYFKNIKKHLINYLNLFVPFNNNLKGK